MLLRQNIAQLILARADERNFFTQRRVCKTWWLTSEYVVTQWFLWLKRRMRPLKIMKTVTMKDQVLRYAVRRERARLDRRCKKRRDWIKMYESQLFEERSQLLNEERRHAEATAMYDDLLAKKRKRICL